MSSKRMSSEKYRKIVEEALRWVKLNQKAVISLRYNYSSPRISSEYPDCAMPLTFDQYNFCSGGCLYCFAYYQKSNNPAVVNNPNSGLMLKSINLKEFKKMFYGEGQYKHSVKYREFFKKRKVLQWGSMADPFDAFERRNRIGLELLRFLAEEQYPVRFSTKFPIPDEHMEILEAYKQNKNFAFIYSIITMNEEIARNIEVGIPSPKERFKQLGKLSRMGYYTGARLRPFIMGASDKTLDEYLRMAKRYGVNDISVEWFALDLRANIHMKLRYAYLSEVLGYDIVNYYKKLSPKSRGTYLRLNRVVKEPFIRKIYQFCVKNRIHFAVSDPDFKELNFSSNCCGLPEPHQNRWHPDLSNFSRAQLTHLIRTARLKFWQINNVDDVAKGKYQDVYIRFSDIANHPDSAWMRDYDVFRDDVVEKTSLNTAEVTLTNPLLSLRKSWNNLSSPKNPMNYFNYKLLPVGYDKDNNIIYKYNPMPYEIYWQTEFGIDLSKDYDF